MLAEFRYAGVKKALDRIAGFLEHAPVGGKARALEREFEIFGHLARPFAKCCRGLRAIERAVDLDGGQALGGVSELLCMRQALWIKQPAPGLKGPAADADMD